MTKKIVLALALLTCSIWVVAQTSPDQSGNSSSQTNSTNSGMKTNETTIRGCLMSSGGNYTLTDSAGVQYQLTGDTSDLSSHANQEVQIRGMASDANGSGAASTGTQGTGTATTQGQPVSFQVSHVKKIANSCSTGK
jgi:hypothetical protein